MKYCKVTFNNNLEEIKLYTYATFFTDLEVGDLLLVQVNSTFTTAMFVSYTTQPSFECRNVLKFIDMKERSKYD